MTLSIFSFPLRASHTASVWCSVILYNVCIACLQQRPIRGKVVFLFGIFHGLVSSLYDIVTKLTGVMEIWQEFEIKVSIDESNVEENTWKLYGFLNFFATINLLIFNFQKKINIYIYIYYIKQVWVCCKNIWESWILSFLANFQLTSSPLTYNNQPGFFHIVLHVLLDKVHHTVCIIYIEIYILDC